MDLSSKTEELKPKLRKVPLSFKDIFSLYSNINTLITKLSEIRQDFKVFNANPLTSWSDKLRMTSFITNQLKKGLIEIDKDISQLLGSV